MTRDDAWGVVAVPPLTDVDYVDDDRPATRGDVRRLTVHVERLESRIAARDRTLFGDDGRGGLVADVNTARAAAYIAVGVGFPVLAGLILWLVASR